MTGEFAIEAELLGVADGRALLKKADGKEIERLLGDDSRKVAAK